jgi:hypothetical protein
MIGVAGQSKHRLLSRLSRPAAAAFRIDQDARCAEAKRMQRERLAQPRGFSGFLEQPSELARSQRPMIAATWKQPALFRRDAAVIIRGRPRLPPLPQQLVDLRR